MRKTAAKIALRIFLLSAISAVAGAAEFYVSPNGRTVSSGSASDPWNLATALAHPAAVRPGDTIWLRGGTYRGTFASKLTGRSGAPIRVRQYPGERATLSGSTTADIATLTLEGSHTWYMGFEVTSSNTRRNFAQGEPVPFGDGLYILGTNLKVINLAIHDNSQGVGFWEKASDSELYGNLIYYNGFVKPDRGHGHGIYTQNSTGTKWITDNILFLGFAGGMHIYGSSQAELNNYEVTGNTFFQNGGLHEGTRSFVMGGTTGNPGLRNLRFDGNYGYDSGKGSAGGNLGFYSPCQGVVFTNNHLSGYRRTSVVGLGDFCDKRAVTMTGNVLHGMKIENFEREDFPSNTYYLNGAKPAGTKVFVRPNRYEPGRANITVFNYDLRSSVDVNVSGVLPSGARYELRNVQDFFGPPVLSGAYDGRSLRVPMTGLRVASPLGWPAPPPTGPEFNAFVLMTVPSPPSGPPPPTPTRTPSPPTPTQTPSTPPPSGTPNPPGPTPTPTPAPPAVPTPPWVPPPTPPPSAPSLVAVTLPVAAHVTGVGGFLFVTDLHIENASGSPANATLSFFPAGATESRRVSLVLAPGETRNFYDVIGNRFGLVNALGALRLETVGPAARGLRMTSRTYSRVGEGTFGQAVSGQPDSPASSGSRYVTGLVRNDDFRSNLGAVNTSGAVSRFSVRLLGADGRLIGATPALELGPGAQMQWSLANLFPGSSGKGLTAELRPEPGSAAPVAYGVVADNRSGDPTYYPAISPARVLTLPGVARVTGVDYAFFVSDISFANPGETPANVTVTFLERDKDNSGEAPSVTFTLGPRQTRQMDDALLTLFGLSETFGALRVETNAESGILVAERISTSSGAIPGTVGQQVDPILENGFFSRGSLLGLREDGSFRSNVGLYNPNRFPVTVALELKQPDGTRLAGTTLALPPRGFVQRNLAVLFGDVAMPAFEVLTLGVDTGGPQVFSFAIIVDNISKDLTFSPGLK